MYTGDDTCLTWAGPRASEVRGRNDPKANRALGASIGAIEASVRPTNWHVKANRLKKNTKVKADFSDVLDHAGVQGPSQPLFVALLELLTQPCR